MGSKLEYILIIAIIIVAIIPFGIEIKNPTYNKSAEAKKSEVNNFIEYELNSTTLKHILQGKSAKEINEDNWYLIEPSMQTLEVKKLSAKSSVFNGKTIVFDKNVVLIKRDGLIYKSNRAIYDLKSKDIITPNSFEIKKSANIVKGRSLEYNPSKRVTKAKDVNGTFILKSKTAN